MKVLLGATSLVGPLTGIGRYTYALCEELRALEQDVTLFYGHRWGKALPIEWAGGDGATTSPGMAARLRPLARKVPFSYRAAAMVRASVFRAYRSLHDIDVYHEPNFIPHAFDGPTVITVHDLSVVRFPEMHPKSRVRAIGARLGEAIARADRVITVSGFVRTEVLEHFECAPEKVVAVPNGVSGDFRSLSAEQCESELARLGLVAGGFVLSVGTFEPRKNLGTLARAWRQLPQDIRKRFPLVLAGARGWGESAFAADLAALAEEGSLVKLDYVDAKTLRALYASARLFVYPSRYEGFGLPVLEAMASGTPVICSNVSSLPEVAGGAAELVDPDSPADIAATVENLLDDEARREIMIARGLDRAAELSWRETARRTLEVYREAMR